MEDKEKLGIEVVVDEPEFPPGAPKPAKAVLAAVLLPVVPKPDTEAVAVLEAAELLAAPKPEN